jgi:hypothetical protein
MSEATPHEELAARLLALCRETVDVCLALRVRRDLGTDHWLMPISTLGEDGATSAVCSRPSARNFRGAPALGRRGTR